MPIRSAASAESWHLESHAVRAPDAPAPHILVRVLHIIAPAAVGGAESVVRHLAVAQRERGIHVTVATIVDPKDSTPLADTLADSSVDVRVLRVPGRAYDLERRELRSLCEAIGPTVLHSHGYRTDLVDALHLRRLGFPIVSTVHGFTGGGVRNRCYEWLQVRGFRQFDAVVAVSSPLQRRLLAHVAPDRLHLVPNAYRPGLVLPRDDARAALGVSPDAFVIGWVGRLSREKGADVFLDALADVSVPDCVRGAILGDGPELMALRRQAIRLSLGRRVTWHGRVTNAARFFSAFDALVLSSRTEGTPMVLFEAMAAGVPLIASAVGGVPDVLVPGTALLVGSEAPRELSAAIRAVVLERAAAAARARAAHARLHQAYDDASWAARYETIYRRAVQTAAG